MSDELLVGVSPGRDGDAPAEYNTTEEAQGPAVVTPRRRRMLSWGRDVRRRLPRVRPVGALEGRSGDGKRRRRLPRLSRLPALSRVPDVRISRVVDARVPPALAPREAGERVHPEPALLDLTRRDALSSPGAPAPDGDGVPRWMRTAGGYSWRILAIVGVVALVVFATARIQIVFVAVFLGLVITSVLRPFVERMSRVVPRPLATAAALLGAVSVVVALVAYVVNSVAAQWASLAVQFTDGSRQILTFLENREGRIPITVTPDMLTGWIEAGRQWVVDHGDDLASNVVASAGSLAEVLGTLALGVFCSVFFLARGGEIWTWFLNQLPSRARRTCHDAGAAGWYTFAGYARGTVIIALADGVLAGVALVVLGVPLAAPLAVLVFIGAFIPLFGAPLAMLVAMVVALAANGILDAVLVGLAIALIGQLEGHVLQPLVMGRQVSLHPLAVALVVTTGTLLSGIVGAVVAVPLIAVAWAVYAKLRNVDPPLSAPLTSIKVTRARERPAPTDAAA
jgi:predicted PurR-regulated permease PerM